jgi:hypothetical protein
MTKFHERNRSLGRYSALWVMVATALVAMAWPGVTIGWTGQPLAKVQIGPFIGTIPVGSFRRHGDGSYTFEGFIDGVQLDARIESTGGLRYIFRTDAKGANLEGMTNPVQVALGVGDNAGLTSVSAHF